MENVLSKLCSAVLEGDASAAEAAAKEAIEAGYEPLKAIQGLSRGIREVGEKFSRGEFFLPDLVMSAEAMKAGMNVFLPEIKRRGEKIESAGRFLIATVAGDIHDIGKSLVSTMLEANGFEVVDLGVDVATETIVDKVKELKPHILGLSALLTTTMLEQGRIIEALQKAGLRERVKVMVGGAAVSGDWAKKIGADAYGSDAYDAVRKAKKLVGAT